MSYFAQFLIKNEQGEIQNMKSPQGIFYLDGRKSIGKLCKDAIARSNQIQSDIVGFEIRKGNVYTESEEIHKWIFRDTDVFYNVRTCSNCMSSYELDNGMYCNRELIHHKVNSHGKFNCWKRKIKY